MGHINLVNLGFLMNRSTGSVKVRIALIDGPVMINHPALENDNIFSIPGGQSGHCEITNSIACDHGTFIAGILKAKRHSDAPAICPGCTLLIRPVFSEKKSNQKGSMPFTTPKELSKAIIDCINAGAHVINLSLAIANPSSNEEQELQQALNYAARLGVIVIAAAGNQGMVGSTAITRHPWVIPVIACNSYGRPLQLSNLGSSIGRRGLSAPGENITSLGAENNTVTFSGTSVAAPFVTGMVALLRSEFPELSASTIKQAINSVNTRRSIIPPVANAITSFQYLTSFYKERAIA